MNYSFETSYPPFLENQAGNKTRQCEEVLSYILKGADNLLQLAQLTGLEQGRISARVNDLIEENKVKYSGFTYYQDRKRKKIIAIREFKQTQLFN